MNSMDMRNSPPPPASLGGGAAMTLFTTSVRARNILLCCLFLIGFLAVPVQSQTTATPAPTATPEPTPLADPSGGDLAACGLPASFATFSSAATLTMTADCTAADSYGANPSFLTFSAGTSTITGGDNRITGTTNGGIIRVTGASTTLTLSNIIFDNTGNSASTGAYILEVDGGATLNVRDVIFRNNVNRGVRLRDGEIHFTNVQFLNNTQPQSWSGFIHIFASDSSEVVDIENALFQGNRGANDMIVNDQGTLRFSGCLIFANNVQADGTTPSDNTAGNIASDTSTTSCPASFITPTPTPTATPTPVPRKKKAEKAAPVPTATARPQIAATHVALQAATGATFRTAFGLDSGVHFRQLDGAGIGIQSIIDAGFLEAFDVYGYVEQGVEVCFPQIGRVIFLDARTMPRSIVALDSTVVNGQTCVSINSPGSLVLLPN